MAQAGPGAGRRRAPPADLGDGLFDGLRRQAESLISRAGATMRLEPRVADDIVKAL